MLSSPFLSIVIPAYNEARSIGPTLRAVRSYLSRQRFAAEVIVWADGDDGTRDIALDQARHDPRLTVLGGPGRGGKGRAVRLGLAHARGRIVGFLDADYKTPVEELDNVLPWFLKGYDLVIGSRARAEARIEVPAPLHRRLGSKAFALAMHLTVGLWDIHDTQCGFKWFRGPVARDLFSRQRIDGYMFDVEVLGLARAAGYQVKEVGVRWRDDGDSRLDLVSGNWRNFLDILRIRFGGRSRPQAETEPAPAEGVPAHRTAA